VLDFADERSVVKTVVATTALQVLRVSLGEPLEAVGDQADAVLAGAHALSPAIASSTQFSFLGQGWAYGIALEAGLKMREAAQLWTESYPQMEYRHGPIAIAQPGRTVWVFGEPVPGLAADVAATGAAFVDDDLDPMADLIRAQLLAVRRAEEHGLDPDRPRHLARSVVLPEAVASAEMHSAP
jgi:glucosamine 6-phosphate synthetase-like amidotransferase/phosphosugar isomerase protein